MTGKQFDTARLVRLQALETTAPASGHLFIRVDTILACKGLWVAIMAVLLASCWCFDGLPAAHFAGWLHAAYQALQGLCGKMMWPVPPGGMIS